MTQAPFSPHARRLKVLFTSTQLTSFIREDLRLLRRHFEVDHLVTRGVVAIVKIAFAVRRADVTFTWFASVYSAVVVFAARWLRKRSIIVVGGVDVAKLPAINYGIFLSPWKSVLVRYALRHADDVLVVDPSLQDDAMRHAQYDGRNIRYVPTGYDATRWTPSATEAKEPFVLTVAICHDEFRMKKKGLDVLFAAARQLPDVRFVVIGILPHLVEHARALAFSNVKILPTVDQDGLLQYYRRAKVYCQPSVTEGLPNSLCEAMLCECIPVGTRVGGIPTGIGETGFLVPYGDPAALATAIRQALQSSPEPGKQARTRIAELFTIGRREEALLKVVGGDGL